MNEKKRPVKSDRCISHLVVWLIKLVASVMVLYSTDCEVVWEADSATCYSPTPPVGVTSKKASNDQMTICIPKAGV